MMLKKYLARFATPVLTLPRMVKRIVAVIVDLSLCLFTVWLAYALRLGEFISFTGQSQWAPGAVWAAAIAIGLALPVFVVS
ncbi:MAG: polysaccharide biosynthesis protein, partial [Nitrosomonas sp.]|nr:polysaccharide biosynthesis protein [Nitrosomonas sp.]